MVYGGTIKKGFSKLLDKNVNISTCYEAAGAFVYGKLHAASGTGSPSDVMDDLELHACPGAGACGGMVRINKFFKISGCRTEEFRFFNRLPHKLEHTTKIYSNS